MVVGAGLVASIGSACTSFKAEGSPPPPVKDASGGDDASDAEQPAETPDASDAASVLALGGDPGIVCGSTTCTAGVQVCCPSGAACFPVNTGACATTFLGCDDGLDCPGADSLCCAQISEDHLSVATSQCRTRNQCSLSGGKVQCDPYKPNPCPDGRGCVQVDGGAMALCSGLP
jgi:hypothetical protein